MMYTMPKNLLSICVNFALATQRFIEESEFIVKNSLEPPAAQGSLWMF